MLRVFAILLLSCSVCFGAAPFFFTPQTNDLVAVPVTPNKGRMTSFLSGKTTTNTIYFGGPLWFNTNSAATVDLEDIFPSPAGGRWERLKIGPRSIGSGTPSSSTFLRGDSSWQTFSVGANPSASVGLSAVNGTATTFLRSDGAPALSQSIAPTWSGVHIFGNTVTVLATVGANSMVNTDAGGALQGISNARGSLIQGGAVNWTTTAIGASGRVWTSDGTDGSWQPPAAGTAGNPTATIGLSAQNGVATTYMRSDAAPPLGVGIAPTWSAQHIWTFGNLDVRTLDAYSTPPKISYKGSVQVDSSLTYSTVGQFEIGKENATDGNNAGFAAIYTRVNGGANSARLTVSSTGTVTIPALAASKYVKTTSGSVLSGAETETANTVFAGPTSGGAAVPAFRGLVAADVPNIDASKITTGRIGAARMGPNTIRYITVDTVPVANGDDSIIALDMAAIGADVVVDFTDVSSPAPRDGQEITVVNITQSTMMQDGKWTVTASGTDAIQLPVGNPSVYDVAHSVTWWYSDARNKWYIKCEWIGD